MSLFALIAVTPARAELCSQYDRWSTAEVERLTAEANQITGRATLPDCEGQNWYICKQVDDLLWAALENLDLVFRGQALGPDGKCLNCDMAALIHGADVIRAWAAWLDARYYKYRGAYGNLYETFMAYKDLPACTKPPPPPPDPSRQSTVLCPTLPGPPLEDQPSLYFETAGGMITDRGFYNFFYNGNAGLYCGYPAAGGSADFTGRYLTQEGNGFVFYGDIGNGTLERQVFHNRLETVTDERGNVWDQGVSVEAATGREIGTWRAHLNR